MSGSTARFTVTAEFVQWDYWIAVTALDCHRIWKSIPLPLTVMPAKAGKQFFDRIDGNFDFFTSSNAEIQLPVRAKAGPRFRRGDGTGVTAHSIAAGIAVAD